jgi:hypothetical protein
LFDGRNQPIPITWTSESFQVRLNHRRVLDRPGKTGSEGKAFQSEQSIAVRGELSLLGKIAHQNATRILSRSLKIWRCIALQSTGKNNPLTSQRNFCSFGKCAQNTVNPW